MISMARDLTRVSTGRKIPTSKARIPITASNSINEKPRAIGMPAAVRDVRGTFNTTICRPERAQLSTTDPRVGSRITADSRNGIEWAAAQDADLFKRSPAHEDRVLHRLPVLGR